MNDYAAGKEDIEVPAFLVKTVVSTVLHDLRRQFKNRIYITRNILISLSPSASPIIAKQVAVNQKVKAVKRLWITIPPTFLFMTEETLLSADIPVRSPRITTSVMCRTREAP